MKKIQSPMYKRNKQLKLLKKLLKRNKKQQKLYKNKINRETNKMKSWNKKMNLKQKNYRLLILNKNNKINSQKMPKIINKIILIN